MSAEAERWRRQAASMSADNLDRIAGDALAKALEARDRRISELEAENAKLRESLEVESAARADRMALMDHYEKGLRRIQRECGPMAMAYARDLLAGRATGGEG